MNDNKKRKTKPECRDDVKNDNEKRKTKPECRDDVKRRQLLESKRKRVLDTVSNFLDKVISNPKLWYAPDFNPL